MATSNDPNVVESSDHDEASSSTIATNTTTEGDTTTNGNEHEQAIVEETGELSQQDTDKKEEQEDEVATCSEPEIKPTSKRTSVFQGHTLHEYEWKPEGNLKAVIHICHGIHEYMGRYELLAEHLKENGILVRGLDLVGHGRSEGDRGYIDSIESYVTDVVNHMKETNNEFSQIPLFLMGHSNGGAVATGVTLRIQDILQGVIFSAPALHFDDSTAIVRFAVKIIASIAPQFGLLSLDENSISSIPEEIKAYNSDPFIYRGKPKAGYMRALLNAINDYLPRLNEISLPILIIHGTEDNLVSMTASNIVFNDTTATDKTIERFEGSRHEILHDKDQVRARELICQWLLARLNGPVITETEAKENTETTQQPLEENQDNTEQS